MINQDSRPQADGLALERIKDDASSETGRREGWVKTSLPEGRGHGSQREVGQTASIFLLKKEAMSFLKGDEDLGKK